MNLGQCIANLLRQYPEVAVPGLGVFRKTSVSAAFDGELRVFLPPSGHIALVEGKGSGELLTDYLQAQAQISDTAAARLLEEKVRDLLTAIQRHGQVLLTGLGYLVADGATVAFKPFETGNHLLGPVREYQLAADTADVETTAAPVEHAAIVYEEPVVEAHNSRRAVWGIAAAVLLLAVSAGGWAWVNNPEWFTGEKKTDEVSSWSGADTPGLDSGLSAATQSGVLDSAPPPINAVAGVPVDSAAADVAAAPVSTATAKATVTYEIIVGSFATMRQAERYVSEMKAKGYEVEAIDSRMPGNRKKISWGSFVTEEEAYRELVRVQKNIEPDAWIAKVVHD